MRVSWRHIKLQHDKAKHIDLTIEIYREPHFTGYGSKTILNAGNLLAPIAFPDAVLDIAELLKR